MNKTCVIQNAYLAVALAIFPFESEAKKKNSCVSGSLTDPKNSGPTLHFFFFKKKKKKINFFFFFFVFFKFHSVTTHTQVVVIIVDYYHN